MNSFAVYLCSIMLWHGQRKFIIFQKVNGDFHKCVLRLVD